MEAVVHLLLPLLHQAAGTDDQAAVQIAAHEQFLYKQTRHDGLAGARIVCQYIAKGLAREQRFIHGRNLVGQRLDQRGVNGQQGIEQVGEMNAMGLGCQAHQRVVGVEAPPSISAGYRKPIFLIPKDELTGNCARSVLVNQLHHGGAMLLHLDR